MGGRPYIRTIMTRALTVLVILATALGAAAGEQKPAASDKTAAKVEAPAPAEGDSPLVAAARRANRLGKKPTNLITNETLKQVGGNAHVTTTTNTKAIQMPKPALPPHPTPEMEVAVARQREQRLADEAAAAARKLAAEREKEQARTAAAAEEGYYEELDHDPARAEQAQQEANQPKPPQF